MCLLIPQVEKGMDPDAAWAETKDDIQKKVRAGHQECRALPMRTCQMTCCGPAAVHGCAHCAALGCPSQVRYGTWLRDTFYTGPDDSGRWCHIKEIQ